LYLQTFLDDLIYDELSDLYASTNLSSVTLTDDHNKVFSLMNSGILDICSRIKLKEKECDLYQRENKSLYYMRIPHVGDPNAGDEEIYIDGTGEDPPNGDIIRWLEAFDADGNEVFINSPGHPYDIFTPQLDVIKITQQEDTDVRIISLVYQANYPKIIIDDDPDPDIYELLFPSFINKALRLYVAAAMYSGKGGKSTEKRSMADKYLYQYESEILKIISLGLAPDKENENSSFENNGWV